MWGSVFELWVLGLGIWVWGLRFGLASEVEGLRLRVRGVGLKVWGLGQMTSCTYLRGVAALSPSRPSPASPSVYRRATPCFHNKFVTHTCHLTTPCEPARSEAITRPPAMGGGGRLQFPRRMFEVYKLAI